VVVPPDDVENTQVPLELTVNDSENPELAVLTVSVAVVADHTDTTKEPPSAPPLSVSCELCTAKADDVLVMEESTLPTAVTVAELLDAVHSIKNVTVVALAATLNAVAAVPADVAANVHVPVVLTVKASEKLDDG
jgi:hypothetical protein